MKHLYTRHIFIVALLIGIATIFGTGLIFFAHIVQRKVMATQEIKQQLAVYERNRAQFNEESKLFHALQGRVQALNGLIVSDENVPSLLSDIETIAQTNALKFNIQNVNTTSDASNKKHLLITCTAEGTLTGIQDFYDALHHQPYLMTISNFSLSQNEGDTVWSSVATIEILSFQ